MRAPLRARKALITPFFTPVSRRQQAVAGVTRRAARATIALLFPLPPTRPPFCQGGRRGFESLLPLQKPRRSPPRLALFCRSSIGNWWDRWWERSLSDGARRCELAGGDFVLSARRGRVNGEGRADDDVGASSFSARVFARPRRMDASKGRSRAMASTDSALPAPMPVRSP